MNVRTVPGFPDYHISDDGILTSTRRGAPKRVRGVVDRDGYRYVTLMGEKGVRHRLSIHVLVLTTFVGPRPLGKQCAHLNGDPADCRVSNLSWTSPKENNDHREAHGTMCRGDTHGRRKLTGAQVVEIRTRHAAGESLSALGREFGVLPTTLCHVVTGNHWKEVGGPIRAPRPPLTDEDALRIRALGRDGMRAYQIAPLFGCSQSNVSMILNNKTFRHLLSVA